MVIVCMHIEFHGIMHPLWFRPFRSFGPFGTEMDDSKMWVVEGDNMNTAASQFQNGILSAGSLDLSCKEIAVRVASLDLNPQKKGRKTGSALEFRQLCPAIHENSNMHHCIYDFYDYGNAFWGG